MTEYLAIDVDTQKVVSTMMLYSAPPKTNDVVFMEKPAHLNIEFSHADYFLENNQIIEKPKES